MRKSSLLLAAAMALGSAGLFDSANADFLLTNGNAAFNPSFTNPAWGASLSNTTKPYQWNTSGNVTSAEGSIFTDAPGAFTASSLGTSPLRAFRWGFRNAGGASGGTAGKGLSNTSGGHSSYVQTFIAGSNTGTIAWGDIFESSRSRLDATIVYTLTDGGTPGSALVKAEATFKNRSAQTETYDFFNLVDSQILGVGAGSNDAVTASVDGTLHTLSFSDAVSGSPYAVNFTADGPTNWEANTSTNINTKVFSGAGNTPTSLIGASGSASGVVVGVPDLFGAFQWRVQLAPNATTTLTSYIGVNTVVPEPASLSLLAAAMPLVWRRRRA